MMKMSKARKAWAELHGITETLDDDGVRGLVKLLADCLPRMSLYELLMRLPARSKLMLVEQFTKQIRGREKKRGS